MLSTSAGWMLAVISISLVWVYLLIRKGPFEALGAAVVMSFVFPVWIKLDVFGLPFSVRTTVAIIALLGYSVHPRGKIISPLTLLDFCIAFMCIVHVSSDTLVTGFTPSLPLRIYGEWVLPYVAGRFAIQNRNDLKSIAPWVAGVLLVLGLASCCEAVTRVNPFEFVFGNRPVELANRSMHRFGLKRAFGPTTHPIYFGMLIAVLTPWLVGLWQSNESERTRSFATFGSAATLAGICCTVSRTPLLTILAMVYCFLALRYRVLRWPLGLTAAVAITGFLIFPTQVTDTVSRWTGGGDKVRIIEYGGQAAEYSSSRSRLWVFSLYSDAMVKAGPTGFGSEALATFPPRIPYTQGMAELSDSMKIIDNAYVVIILRFGWLGGCCLLLLFATAVMTGLSLHMDRPDQLLPGAVACLLGVVGGLSVLLVSMNYDFGLPILWTIGILSGLASARTRQRVERSLVSR